MSLPRSSVICIKTSYRDPEEAKRAIQLIRISRRKNNGKKPCRWYECDECGLIHLTSQPTNPFEEKGSSSASFRGDFCEVV